MGRPRGSSLNRSKVIETARRIAETGIPNLSMTSLSSALGVTPMAIYRHVRNKQDLMALVLDDVLSEVDVPGRAEGDWAARLRVFQRDVTAALNRLPGLSDVLYEVSPTWNASRLMEGYFDILLDSGLAERDVIGAYTTLYYLAVGALSSDNARRLRSLPSSPAANIRDYPSDLLPKMAQLASNVGDDELHAWGVEAVISRIAASTGQVSGNRRRKT
jgi:AcrR family transcriptional regulator